MEKEIKSGMKGLKMDFFQMNVNSLVTPNTNDQTEVKEKFKKKNILASILWDGTPCPSGYTDLLSQTLKSFTVCPNSTISS